MSETPHTPKIALDATDKEILRLLQEDAARPLERIAERVGISKTAVWNRIQRLERDKVIQRRVAIVDEEAVGLSETVFVVLRTSQHSADWLKAFTDAIKDSPEILEAHRLAGDLDYILKVKVRSTREYDTFYKRLISRVSIHNVSSSFSLETLKATTKLPL